MGNAALLVQHSGARLRYCKPWKRWLAWTGANWERDERSQAQESAKQVLDQWLVIAEKANSDTQSKAILQHYTRSRSGPHLAAMLTLAKSDPGMAILPDDFNEQPGHLATPQGFVDLNTGHVTTHRPTNLNQHVTSAAWETSADQPTPLWTSFLERVQPDPLVRDFLQAAIGYSILGAPTEQVMFLNYGDGMNGKSTFAETLGRVLGTYARKANATIFMGSKSETRNDLAALMGARIIWAAETRSDGTLDEQMVKQITGGDTVTVRYLYGEFFQFQPTFVPWLLTNHRPGIKSMEHAMWRRIRLVPWRERLSDAEHVNGLVDLMSTTEASGILRWAYAGCLRYRRDGLMIPPSMAAEVGEYRAEEDQIGQFLRDECMVGRSSSWVASSEIYAAYKAWCARWNTQPVGWKALAPRLVKEPGVLRDRITSKRIYRGIELSTSPIVTTRELMT